MNTGIYGNVSSNDAPKSTTPQAIAQAKITRFGKLKDLLSATTGDYIFLFERDKSRLHGVWNVFDEPHFCTSNIFDPSDTYPYRLRLQHRLNFPNPVPATELRKLLDNNLLWSVGDFEQDPNAPFMSIIPISIQETGSLLDLFWKYNHRRDPNSRLMKYSHPPLKQSINFHDLVMNTIYSSGTPLEIKADNFGQPLLQLPYEEAIHCYIIYNLARQPSLLRNVFGECWQVLREVPISITGQNRPDVLLIYKNAMTGEPSVYSIMEIKRGRVKLDMMKQLVEYLGLFSERHDIDLNSIEGIYLGKDFTQDVSDYIGERTKIEVERPIILFKYSISGNTIVLNPA